MVTYKTSSQRSRQSIIISAPSSGTELGATARVARQLAEGKPSPKCPGTKASKAERAKCRRPRGLRPGVGVLGLREGPGRAVHSRWLFSDVTVCGTPERSLGPGAGRHIGSTGGRKEMQGYWGHQKTKKTW